MSNEKRKYEQRLRADAVAETRQRITEAAMELHGSIGPSRTTLTAVAERAGVGRPTLYRHFPTESDLFDACSAHFAMSNPLPDVEAWREIEDPRTRLTTALGELYAHYERIEAMWSNIIRDAETMPVVREHMAPIERYLRTAEHVLAAGWPVRGARRRVVNGALRHAVAFTTWRSLARDGDLSRVQAVDLVSALVGRAAS